MKASRMRTCGECSACCMTHLVEELEKPCYKPCKHLCGGCAIYEGRPESCRSFECGWLNETWHDELGLGDERHRPDTLGLIFDGMWVDGKLLLSAWEVWPNASQDEKARYLLEKISKKGKVAIQIVLYGGELFRIECNDVEFSKRLSERVITLATERWTEANQRAKANPEYKTVSPC